MKYGPCGHVAAMFTCWLGSTHFRPNGCHEMTWGWTLRKALKYKGLPVNFKEWRAIAEDKPEWRSRTYSKPMPPSENSSYKIHKSKDEHCISRAPQAPRVPIQYPFSLNFTFGGPLYEFECNICEIAVLNYRRILR